MNYRIVISIYGILYNGDSLQKLANQPWFSASVDNNSYTFLHLFSIPFRIKC